LRIPVDVVISLTEFMDFLNATGAAKASCVKKISGYEYAVQTDFWRGARSAIVSHARGAITRDGLISRLSDRPEPHTQRYAEALEGYLRVKTPRTWTWVDPPRQRRVAIGRLGVRVNVELAFESGGNRRAIKLFFRRTKVSAHRLVGGLYLMSKAFPDFEPSILDVKTGRMITAPRTKADLVGLIRGEALSFMAMWDSLHPQTGVPGYLKRSNAEDKIERKSIPVPRHEVEIT
jgi:hypothetical protein